jgi:hypothetical protein
MVHQASQVLAMLIKGALPHRDRRLRLIANDERARQ